jgi:proline dehydrogenase
MQDAADDLVTEMMRKYRKSNCFSIHSNVSLGSFGLLEKSYMIRQKKKVFYRYEVGSWHMEKKITERNTPICSSKEATDTNYDAAVRYMIDHLEIIYFCWYSQ